jgi:glycosyltransferase involved in cell wall biosynthesis
MNIADNYPRTVFLRGHQPSSLIYSEIDILLHCSLEFDPLPTVLLEASRAGIPAIATDLGGAREIIQHKVSGFLFNPKDPSLGKSYLELLVNSEELRFRMGNAARSIYEMNFTVQNMVNHYRALWTNSW